MKNATSNFSVRLTALTSIVRLVGRCVRMVVVGRVILKQSTSTLLCCKITFFLNLHRQWVNKLAHLLLLLSSVIFRVLDRSGVTGRRQSLTVRCSIISRVVLLKNRNLSLYLLEKQHILFYGNNDQFVPCQNRVRCGIFSSAACFGFSASRRCIGSDNRIDDVHGRLTTVLKCIRHFLRHSVGSISRLDSCPTTVHFAVLQTRI